MGSGVGVWVGAGVVVGSGVGEGVTSGSTAFTEEVISGNGVMALL